MPMNKALYPSDWKEISHRIRFVRAKGRCEECGVRHGAFIVRQPGTRNFWYYNMVTDEVRWSAGTRARRGDLPAAFEKWKVTRVILTVHHIGVEKDDGSPGSPHDKSDCRDVNLIALCQRCHLLADLPEHVKSRKKTRSRNRHSRLAAAGQRSMFDE